MSFFLAASILIRVYRKKSLNREHTYITIKPQVLETKIIDRIKTTVKVVGILRSHWLKEKTVMEHNLGCSVCMLLSHALQLKKMQCDFRVNVQTIFQKKMASSYNW